MSATYSCPCLVGVTGEEPARLPAGSSMNRRNPGSRLLKFFLCTTKYGEWPNAMKFQNEVIFERYDLKNLP